MASFQGVEEIPGLYGSLRIEEKVIQQIWADQDFNDLELHTECGKRLIISNPGIWNRAEEGPDFKNASLSIDQLKQEGDIEIHFYSSDWENHGHNRDANYNRVALHVTLFPEAKKRTPCQTMKGVQIPLLVLLPHLRQSLEEHMESIAIENLSAYVAKNTGSLYSRIDQFEVTQKNHELAKERWLKKKQFAQKRLQKSKQEEAFHQCFLEVLGYRRNRAIMSKIGQSHPTQEWKCGAIDPDEVFQSEISWKLKGLRPANHPRKRLRQYGELWRANPNWIEDLLKINIPFDGNSEGSNRKNLGIHNLKKLWIDEILCGVWGGTRVDTLWVDACLPLLAEVHRRDYFPTWFHWFAGDFPDPLKEVSRSMGIAGHSRAKPFSNGPLQGLLGYCIKKGILG